MNLPESSGYRSTTWPEPEAISILAEGVWAPKEHNPLPDLSGLLGAHVDSDHTQSSIDEKLGVRVDHGSTSSRGLLFADKLWMRVKRVFDQAVRRFQVSLGLIHTDSSQASKDHRDTGVLRVVHFAAVVVHLGLALWLLRTGCSWLLGRKQSALSGDWRRSPEWVSPQTGPRLSRSLARLFLEVMLGLQALQLPIWMLFWKDMGLTMAPPGRRV